MTIIVHLYQPYYPSLGDNTICNSSVVEISSLRVDTPPRRREVELSEIAEGDDRRRDEDEEMPTTNPRSF